MEETVKDRLLQFLDAKGITKGAFCRVMGLSPAYVSSMRKSLSDEKVRKMCALFPDLNRDWLLYGEGEMTITVPESAPFRERFEGCIIPLLPVDACAGSFQNYSRGIGLADCDMVSVPVSGADFAIHITGDSMEPQIHDGSIAAIKRIDDSMFIPWGNPVVIDTENGVLVKLVFPSDKGEDFIEAKSVNPRYPPIRVPKSCIYGIYRIMAFMKTVVTM